MYYNQEELAFKPITENPIILNFSNCKDTDELHQILKKKFGLPEYYGENWDALWDCLSYLWVGDGDVTVEIHGYNKLLESLEGYGEIMFKIFDRVHEQTPNVVFKIIS